MNKLISIDNSWKAYATLALEFVELSANEDIIAD